MEQDSDIFYNNIKSILGDRRNITFLNNKWLVNQYVKDVIPDLFSVTENPNGSVAYMGAWSESVWVCNLQLKLEEYGEELGW